MQYDLEEGNYFLLSMRTNIIALQPVTYVDNRVNMSTAKIVCLGLEYMAYS